MLKLIKNQDQATIEKQFSVTSTACMFLSRALLSMANASNIKRMRTTSYEKTSERDMSPSRRNNERETLDS